jgi:H2-forming N5,N10-methylenetetrahydromethanopterin dehydrogenase-like enzyme
MQGELQMLERVSNDNEWFQKNYENLKKDFKNEFVAIKDKQIIAHNKNFDIIIKILGEKGENPAIILIEFVTEKGIEIIL